MQNSQIIGFPPIEDSRSRILILGSMPGIASLEKQEYYAHPRNLFWTFIEDIVGTTMPTVYEEKKSLLLRNNIALWDICKCCIRPGSLDSNIYDEVANDISHFVATHSQLHSIFFNGNKSAQLFKKHIGPIEGIRMQTLPSSSPANASIAKEQKLEIWRKEFYSHK